MQRRIQTHTWRKSIGMLAAIPLTLIGIGIAPLSAQAAQPSATVPRNGLIADYSFAHKPVDGVTVSNTANSDLGPAKVQRGANNLWKDAALTFTGGTNDTTGDWVRLPDNILKGKKQATVQIEVRPTVAMTRDDYHFVWNIGNSTNAQYVFAALRCGGGRLPLVGVKTEATGEALVQSSSCTITPDQWSSVTGVFNGNNAKMYINGKLVADGDTKASPADVKDQSLNTIGRSPWNDPLFQGAVSSFRVWNRALTATEAQNVSINDAQAHEQDFRNEFLPGNAVPASINTSGIVLPTFNGVVSWSSSNSDVINATTGRVIQPARGEPAKTVILSATARFRGLDLKRNYTVTVQPDIRSAQEIFAEHASGYIIPSIVRTGDKLPLSVSGITASVVGSKGINITSDGIVTNNTDSEQKGTVTVRLSAANNNETKTFPLTVLPKSSAVLAAYDRTPTSADEANNGDIAYSMHLALRNKDGSFTPYNENYGIFFPRLYREIPQLINTVDYARSLKDPSLFYTKDGSFGIVAVRTQRGSSTIASSDKGKILVATSPDLLTYNEKPASGSLIDLGVTDGINKPIIRWDGADNTYVLGWTSNAGIAYHTTITALDGTATHGAIQEGEIPNDRLAAANAQGITNFRSGTLLPITAKIRKGLDIRFARITNTGRSYQHDITVDEGTKLSNIKLPKVVDLSYSDGSTGTLPINWDLSTVDTSKPGTYTVNGTIKQTEYQVPFAEERADPSVYKWHWTHIVNGKKVTQTKYLFIATNDIQGDCTWQHGHPHMPFRMADSIEALADTPNNDNGLINSQGFNPKETSLLVAGDKDADGNSIRHSFWAPEFHEINGRLTILFMAGYDHEWTDGHAVYMRLKQDKDGYDMNPSKPKNWEAPVTILRSDGKPLATDANGNVGMSLDMTYFKDADGQSYYAWQQLGATYIAKVNPANPSRITTNPVRIVTPEYAWNVTIAEGPNVKLRNGKLYLIFSGSSVGKTYTTGLAVAKASGTDLTKPSSWTVLNYPIQKSGPFNGKMQLGTGHGMWSEDENGNDLYVFHAYAPQTPGFRNFSGRDTFVRRVHWAADGYPIFDMDQKEELTGSKKVTASVRVEASSTPSTPSQPSSVDKSALSNAVVKAGQADLAGYTSSSAKRLSDALGVARRVLSDSSASQSDVDAALKALRSALSSLVSCPVPSFRDVAAGDWFYPAVRYVNCRGVMKGYGRDRRLFGPADRVTREQAALVLYRWAGSPSVSGRLSYRDARRVSPWARDAVLWASRVRLMNGYGRLNVFGPQDGLTRSQAAALVARASGRDIRSLSSAMDWAVSHRVINGWPDWRRLDPDGVVDRAQIAQILSNAIQKGVIKQEK